MAGSLGFVQAMGNMKDKRRIRRDKKERARSMRQYTYAISKYNSIEKSLKERTSQRHKTLDKQHTINIKSKSKGKSKSNSKSSDSTEVITRYIGQRLSSARELKILLGQHVCESDCCGDLFLSGDLFKRMGPPLVVRVD